MLVLKRSRLARVRVFAVLIVAALTVVSLHFRSPRDTGTPFPGGVSPTARSLLEVGEVAGNSTDCECPEHEEELVSGSVFWGYVGICVFLVFMAGVMSGLTLGLLSLDLRELEILARVGNDRERKLAPRLIPVCKKHHWVLVTLLLGNAGVLEALPIFLDRLVSAELAIIISVTAVLFFGEIIPQALCSRFGLAIGANLAWFVTFLLWASAPVTWPISKLLDCLLGSNHVTFYRKAQLKEFITLHSQGEGGGPLSTDEILVMQGALDMHDKTVTDAMVPIMHVFMLDSSSHFDLNLLREIRSQGHSRIPVFHETRENIIGILLVKNLIGMNPADGHALKDMKLRQPPRLSADTPMYECLDLMQTGQSHMALVVKGTNYQEVVEAREKTPRVRDLVGNPDEGDGGASPSAPPKKGAPSPDSPEANEVIGIITLEDIVEELIGEEIVDETDVYEDVTTKAKKVRISRLERQSSRGLPARTLLGGSLDGNIHHLHHRFSATARRGGRDSNRLSSSPGHATAGGVLLQEVHDASSDKEERQELLKDS